LPAGAVFDETGSRWEDCPRNERGEPHGTWASFSADGALRVRRSFRDGKLDGYVSHFTDGKPGTPPLRTCCVPPAARELRVRYREGRYVDEVFLDEHGAPLSDDGTPWPERPANLPEHAYWVKGSGTFVEHVDRDPTQATIRYFDAQGTLLLEHDTVSGRLHGRRQFGVGGICLEDTELDENGKHHGAYVACFTPGETPYADRQIAKVRGAYEHGERIGTWEFVAASGAVIGRAEHGAAWREGAPPVVLGTEPTLAPEATTRWSEAARLWDERRAREALAVAARALAVDGDVGRFRAFLAERVVPLEPERARELSRLADEARASMGSMLGALLGGAEPAATLCSLGMSLPTTAPAALDYVEASYALAPERERSLAARALLRVERGDREGALEDAARLSPDSEATASFLRDLVRIAYPSFTFAPALDPPTPPDEDLVPVEPAQPLDAVRHTVSLYVTRLMRVRAELVRRVGPTPAWLPPDLGALLPEGPVELARTTVRIEDEGENGVEVSDVEVDETLDLDRSVRGLLELSRGDWVALSWLCWSTGLDEVALPEALEPRELFPAAAHRATWRCWRAHDRQRSAGLVARARNVPSFDWEGMAIDAMPTDFSVSAAREYLELRALFFWLLFPQNCSPFQADLRKA
jgi:hypothetical protein